MKVNTNDKKVAGKMIDILQKAGYTPDEMTRVIRMARRQHMQMKLNSAELKN